MDICSGAWKRGGGDEPARIPVRIDMYSVGRQLAVPGKVVEGMDVLDRYQDVPVDGEAPKERIELKSVRIAMIAK
jgi:hypothetical protein